MIEYFLDIFGSDFFAGHDIENDCDFLCNACCLDGRLALLVQYLFRFPQDHSSHQGRGVGLDPSPALGLL